jgi:hypothetical protein
LVLLLSQDAAVYVGSADGTLFIFSPRQHASVAEQRLSCQVYDIPNSNSLMTKPCFRKVGSNPPICGVHNVPLERTQLSAEMVAAGYKGFTFLVCPVSGTVLNEIADIQTVKRARP